jgi:hypothetical protein
VQDVKTLTLLNAYRKCYAKKQDARDGIWAHIPSSYEDADPYRQQYQRYTRLEQKLWAKLVERINAYETTGADGLQAQIDKMRQA